jgi:eukaryotic-like serine/threonine-protein kinase
VEPEQPPPRRRLPPSIGRYRIVDRLGKGAMGVVYSAHDGLMERSVAIKVMMTDLEDDPETSTRFYREARAAGQLVHPNIITIFDMGEDDGRPFIVMELVQGWTLNKYLERPEGSDIEKKIDLMLQMCAGLHAAHTHGIFHRDIKPGNLLVGQHGELKIVDFGIARLASSNMTASGLIVGTPDYMSPEQARGPDVDQRSDIFSVGAVFYLMLTGRKPFTAADPISVLAKVQSEAPLPIRDTEAPAALTKLVMKALAKDPAERYQSCARMIAELEHVKRDLENETKHWVDECGQRLKTLESLIAERRTLIDALDIAAAAADVEAARAELVSQLASLTEPYRQRAVAPLVVEIRRQHDEAAGQVERWHRALSSVEQGLKTAGSGATREAIAHFERALEIEPASRRAAAEADKCRGLIAAQRAIDDRARALLDEARRAAAAKQWQAVIVLCDDALLLDNRVEEATALKRTAIAAIEAEARERQAECERALARAEALRTRGRFDEATREIARAKELYPLYPASEIAAVEDRLTASIADAEREALWNRQAADAVAAARSTFAAGRRDEALVDLRSFHARVPHALAAAEITRLDAEAKRLAIEERRAAEAAEHAKSADAALQAGEPERALELAGRALAIDPGHVLARKVSGLAGAEVKQRADAKAREAKAARQIEDAKEQLARGKFQKARELVSAASDLTPGNPQHKLLLARIQEAETRLAEEAERQRLAKQRAKAVAPILERARTEFARGEYERAAWTAENALAVDPDCKEAQQILRDARALIETKPIDADDTVDLTNDAARKSESDDDTVSFTRPVGMWERLTGAVKKWTQGDAPEPPATRPASDGKRVKTHLVKQGDGPRG